MARGGAVVILSLLVSLSLAQGIRPPWPRPAEPLAPPAPAAPDDRTVRDYRPGQGWVDVRWDAKARRWEPLARRDDATRDVGPPPDEAEATRRRAEWSALKQRAEQAEADATEQRRRAEQAEAGLDALVRSDAYEARGRRQAAPVPAAVPQRTSPAYVQPAPQVAQPAAVVYAQPAPQVVQPAPVVYAQPAPQVVQPAPVVYAQPAPVLQVSGPAYGTSCPNCGRAHGFMGFGGGFRSVPIQRTPP
jgi:hypothetical protein